MQVQDLGGLSMVPMGRDKPGMYLMLLTKMGLLGILMDKRANLRI